MFKYVIIISLGYVLYKIVKNGAFLAIENFLKNKQLGEPTDLVQCTQCQNFTSRDLTCSFFICSAASLAVAMPSIELIPFDMTSRARTIVVSGSMFFTSLFACVLQMFVEN